MESLPRFLLNKYRPQIGIFLVLAILVGGGVVALTAGDSKSPEIEKVAGTASSVSEHSESTVSGVPTSASVKIKIDIAGAVANPGVYELPEDSRVEDALSAAGGLSDQADRDWVSRKFNLAAKLSDGDKLYIPRVGESEKVSGLVSGTETSSADGGSSSATGGCSRVNINTASAATLADCLWGIRVSKAESIIEYRESHGGFKSIEEIQEVRGIGPTTFAKIKDQIVVD